MRVAFVGVKRKYQELPAEYRDFFNQYHLELPYYYACASNDVTITTVDYDDPGKPVGSGHLECVSEENFRKSDTHYDVVIHWRKWFPELYRPEAVNVINCQDHSFSPEWKAQVRKALIDGQLYGILCFPTWHKANLNFETGFPVERLLDGVTLGVDTDIYKPAEDKDPFQLLWASDPGRGFQNVLPIAVKLWQMDRRFKLHVCYPDYVKGMSPITHPAIEFHGNVPNGPELWKLFNRCGVLPYPSTFTEPSSRAHRQAQAAGSLVLYPPHMGSPSYLIQDLMTGIVSDPQQWPAQIFHLIGTGAWADIGKRAREYAISENWQVQAKRFNELFGKILGR